MRQSGVHPLPGRAICKFLFAECFLPGRVAVDFVAPVADDVNDDDYVAMASELLGEDHRLGVRQTAPLRLPARTAGHDDSVSVLLVLPQVPDLTARGHRVARKGARTSARSWATC